MVKCKICGKELNPANVQQGGCHMDCYNRDLTVYKVYQICDVDGTYYVEKDMNKIVDTLYCLPDWDDEDGIGIRVSTMPHGEYLELPEFEGF